MEEIADEELPPVSEAFGIRLGLTSDHPRSLALLSTSNTSRYSVRATTFDGRSVQIKRKPKISQEARNVSAEKYFFTMLYSYIY